MFANSLFKSNINIFFLRKTDALKDMVHKYRMPELKKSYYLSAMDFCVEKYPKKRYNVLFLLVSCTV